MLGIHNDGGGDKMQDRNQAPHAMSGQHPSVGTAFVTEDRVRLMIHDSVQSVMSSHESEMRDFIGERFDSLEKLIRSAFPDGDPIGHRAAHEAEIERYKLWKKIRNDFISKAVTAGFIAASLFVLAQIGKGVKEWLAS